ncbi:hypothetical protein BCV70DRAFT_202300 [Testicularia cyperi]|uniref:Uncharacterized protein n=1 Tax=Testicularia cyperi TaxID=1882483 RepID=A0A317XJU9_9BASI|nr:hypothetical protein BCV70DRAFT_202300 [Testicularia cyperi]
MDPAFSLADELELSDSSAYPQDHLVYDQHLSLGDEFGEAYAHEGHGHELADALGTELEGLHMGGGAVSDLAAELEGLNSHDSHMGGMSMGSLADELDSGLGAHDEATDDLDPFAMSRGTSHVSSPYASASDAYDPGFETPPRPSGTSSPSAKQATLPRSSGFSTPSRVASGSSFRLQTSSIAQEAEIQDNIKATEQFLRHLESITSSSSAPKGASASSAAASTENGTGALGSVEPGGDTARLEMLANRFLKLVYECTNEREAQLRELRELDRQSSRLTTALPSFSLPSSTSFSSDVASTSYGSTALGSSMSLSDLPEEDAVNTGTDGFVDSDDDDDDYNPGSSPISPTTPLTPRQPRSLHKSHKSTASTGSDATITSMPSGAQPLLDTSAFSALQSATTSLVGSLTNLHEHSQVTKSSVADAARKLRSLKNVIGQWKTEQDLVERSEDWIEKHGATSSVRRLNSSSPDEPATDDVRAWTSAHIDFCRKRLEEAEARARVLLTPVSITS